MKISIIVLGNNKEIKNNKNVEILYSNNEKLLQDIKKAKSEYISIIKSTDEIADNYIDKILEKINNKPDCILINYDIKYDYKNIIKKHKNEVILKQNNIQLDDYIFSYVFKKDKLIKLLETKKTNFNEKAIELFQNKEAIADIIYYHNPKEKSLISDFPLVDKKNEEYHKNIIYVGSYCNGVFNGYITWIDNLGKCFSEKYDITIIYDEIYKTSLKKFQKYFKCIKRQENTNYICDRLLVTYSTFYYPKNIIYLEENYLFIHGNMSDYNYTVKYEDDIYTKYIAVSKISAEKAIGYFETKKIYYLYNPFKLEDNIMPHLKLVSAQRASDEKKASRIEAIASILDEEEIPYTWNVFTDNNEGTNKGGLIFRQRTTNPYPYIKDSDYFVLLSDSEACPYVIIEALELNTKVVVTPLEVHKELGANENNSITIPFEYFKKENKEKLKEIVLKMYINKDKKYNYKYSPDMFKGYNFLFKK
ncbi:MAG: hypothetical protein IKG40_01185 [Bacilli bacterium]|nr:hypothetical protein [Bacilli bacterium]